MSLIGVVSIYDHYLGFDWLGVMKRTLQTEIDNRHLLERQMKG